MSVLKVNPKDNVLVALQSLGRNSTVEFDGETYHLPKRVAAKHKFVTEKRGVNDPIIMYGVIVGRATKPIEKGEIITTENVIHATQETAYQGFISNWEAPDIARWEKQTFMGYHRTDGQVGTANYWLVVPLVFCENRNVQVLKEAFEKNLGYRKPDKYSEQVQALVHAYQNGHEPFNLESTETPEIPFTRVFSNLDGIKFLTHEGGCGGTRQDAEALCGLIAGYLNHPNVCGGTILSLGCQHAQMALLKDAIKQRNPHFDKVLLFFEEQRFSSEHEMLSHAIQETFEELIEANKQERKPAPLSKLVLGVECGGSDGFSGISANPSIGYTSDLLVALGGTTILSEFPELCGVEQELVNRCVSPSVAEKFLDLMESYNERAKSVGSGFDMNPSPGNIRDGLITDAIKSAGAAKKGGTSPVNGVLDYPEYISQKGLNLLCTPGNDVESTTAMAGSGATVMLFSTGLGTPTGNPIVPVLKISTNTTLAERMPWIIDYDAGQIIQGKETIETVGEALLKLIIETASGIYVPKAVELGQDDFIPWKRGVSL